MPQITIKFTGDDAEETKESFFDWWDKEGRDGYYFWCDCQELGIIATTNNNLITIET